MPPSWGVVSPSRDGRIAGAAQPGRVSREAEAFEDATSLGGVDNRLDHAETASAVRARKDVHVERAPEKLRPSQPGRARVWKSAQKSRPVSDTHNVLGERGAGRVMTPGTGVGSNVLRRRAGDGAGCREGGGSRLRRPVEVGLLAIQSVAAPAMGGHCLRGCRRRLRSHYASAGALRRDDLSDLRARVHRRTRDDLASPSGVVVFVIPRRRLRSRRARRALRARRAPLRLGPPRRSRGGDGP